LLIFSCRENETLLPTDDSPAPQRRQQIESEFIAALQAAGIKSTLVDAAAQTHDKVNSQIGAAGDRVMTEPSMKFLMGCFE
jgi:hypothetical protein